MYDSEDVPNGMLESIFIALPTRSGTVDCKTCRTISLMSHVKKMVLRVMLTQNKNAFMDRVSDEQFIYIYLERELEMQSYA